MALVFCFTDSEPVLLLSSYVLNPLLQCFAMIFLFYFIYLLIFIFFPFFFFLPFFSFPVFQVFFFFNIAPYRGKMCFIMIFIYFPVIKILSEDLDSMYVTIIVE